MAQLRQDYEKFTEKNAEIVTIGPEKAEAFRKYWVENEMPFVGLPDPDHSVLKRYGQQVKLFKLGRMPAQMIIDKAGTLRYIHYGHSMQDIPENAELLQLLDEMGANAEPAES
jgi:peroxiredoxin